jgi:phosphatidylinositol dimannoside acyltransferase
MSVNPQAIINSRLGIALAMSLGQSIPPRLGYPLANKIADFISSRKNWKLIQAVRTNQWVIHQGRLSREDLDLQTRRVFQHTAHCLYDMYRYFRTPTEFQKLVIFSTPIEEIIRRSQSAGKGMLVVGMHMSNFDFVMQLAARRGLKALVLSVPNPGGGYQLQNELRRRSGVEIIPASISSLRTAVTRLKAGGVVLTGLDRPMPHPEYRPKFFGYPSNLPVFYVQLAILAQVPIIVASALMDEKGIYHIQASEPITIVEEHDKRTEILANTERVLEVAAGFIRQAPQQWSMAYPIWPEVIDQIP